MKAVLLVSHGSRSSKTIKEVKALIRALKIKMPRQIIEFAFLEIEKSSIPEGVELCLKKGAHEIMILLNFLNSGRHVDEDIPRIINQLKRKHPLVYFKISKPVGQHKGIVTLFSDLIES